MIPTMRTNNFFAIKLTFERIAITLLLVFCISITVLFVKQKKEIQQLKSEINQQETSLRNVDSRVDDLENQNSDLENKINDLESRIDDLESNSNY
jgi:predicted  nucleic acid-binding Zn-ribbon protein